MYRYDSFPRCRTRSSATWVWTPSPWSRGCWTRFPPSPPSTRSAVTGQRCFPLLSGTRRGLPLPPLTPPGEIAVIDYEYQLVYRINMYNMDVFIDWNLFIHCLFLLIFSIFAYLKQDWGAEELNQQSLHEGIACYFRIFTKKSFLFEATMMWNFHILNIRVVET